MTDNAETMEVYTVVSNTDTTEGKGCANYLYSCKTEATALRLAKGKGVQGSMAAVIKYTAVKSEGVWLVPGRIISPNHIDMARQNDINERNAIIEKARLAGLSDDEITKLSMR